MVTTWISLALSVATSLVVVALAFATLRAKVAAHEATIRELREEFRASNIRQGERLGELEGWKKAVEAVERERTRTGAIPITPGERGHRG
jgi:hypothetical protein